MNRITRARLARLTTIMLAALACGCAAMSPAPPAQSGANAQAAAKPIPRVEDCAVLNTGTPSRFACNGKVYTSYQLAKLREDAAKKKAAGQ